MAVVPPTVLAAFDPDFLRGAARVWGRVGLEGLLFGIVFQRAVYDRYPHASVTDCDWEV